MTYDRPSVSFNSHLAPLIINTASPSHVSTKEESIQESKKRGKTKGK